MTKQTYNTQQNMVQELRKIRDQISNEIKEMTFEEERAYLDKLLTAKNNPTDSSRPGNTADNAKRQQH